jgi:hypothetical protein
MQSIPIIITPEILIVKMPYFSNHLLSNILFETVDFKLAHKYLVCQVYSIAETHCKLDTLTSRLWSRNFWEEGCTSVTRI